MATLHERKNYRAAVLKALYRATAENRPGTPGSRLRDDLGLPEQDLAAACTYLVGEGLVEVDWTTHRTPAMVTLTHEGIRQMEAEEEEREARG
ncbi:hypothetical protein ACFXN2_13620 [Streptomyces kronopolitis]|uniref:hypothetical protein n=1 Tax=Streptomyces TaxID=1883 RepID=UPI0020BF0FB9|nr:MULTISPECIES: hypothetical protein [Streptomyces]MCL6297147.1 hypothetical protein [Streptomyces kronopolitis]GLW16838.1 hypothetical protein Stsp01_35810 [Streptomyces sp. NBRC 13847]